MVAQVHSLDLTRPDGRHLTLYSRRALPGNFDSPAAFTEPLQGSPHLRWNPVRAEWVAYAAYRQDRTFLPPPEYNPLAPTTNAAPPTELPPGDWEVAAFDNRFPSLSLSASEAPELIVPTAPAKG